MKKSRFLALFLLLALLLPTAALALEEEIMGRFPFTWANLMWTIWQRRF